MSYDAVPELLEAMSDEQVARKLRSQVQPLRGIRGVPLSEVARIAAAAWAEKHTTLPRDAGALNRLFSTAFEDGLVAIGLLASCVPDSPADALDIGLDWVARVDDVLTADALGWLVLGPASLASGQDMVDGLSPLRGSGSGAIRRAAVSAAMAATPTRIEGPAAAPIRARLGIKHVQWVDKAQSDLLARVCTHSFRDESPQVRKALRRLLRAWADSDPAAAAAWADDVKGGLPKLFKAEADRARKKAKQLASS